MTQNKKRKQSPICSDHHDHDGKMFDDHDQNIESVLFDEMTTVNSKLISLGNNFKLVDNLYFVRNSGMVDEFIGNMQQFMKELENHRTKVAFGKLNSDILSHVYQFLDTKTLKNCCGLVSKLWRESLIGLKVKVMAENASNFLNSSLVNHVTELKFKFVMHDKTKTSMAKPLMLLANCKNLHNLKVLKLSGKNILDSECVEYLKKCNMPNLTEFKLYESEIEEKCVIELLNSNFMSSIKKLDLLYVLDNCTNNFYESVSESKYLQQITHLEVWNDQPQIGKRIDLLLKKMINLEYLEMVYYELSHFPNMSIYGNYNNLKYLDISYCHIKNQEFANLFISPSLPNLENIQAKNLNLNCRKDELDRTIAVFPPNSQSSITELNFTYFYPELFPSLFDPCSKLKKLTLYPEQTEKSMKAFLNMMKSPGLSKLEYLCTTQIVEEFFINPIYSNLKEIELDIDYVENMDIVKLLSNCTNLVNLTRLDLSGIQVTERSLIEEISKAIHNNATFAKLKDIELPEYYSSNSDSD